MKVIIAGSRTIKDAKLVEDAIRESGFAISEVVSGKAKGVDTLGELWAKKHGVAVKGFIAHWKDLDVPGAVVYTGDYGLYNKNAGFDRNQKMADYADALIAVTTGSSGTADMIRRAVDAGLKVYVKEVK